MTPHDRCTGDEEDARLLAKLEALHASERDAAYQLSHPRQSMLYPTYKRMEAAVTALQAECHEARHAFRAHRKKMRDEVKAA
jgi:hypothetical protein